MSGPRVGRLGGTPGWVMRVVAVATIAWAVLAPVYSVPRAATAADRVGPAPIRQSGGGYSVAGGAIQNYYAARGGARTFGPVVSNAFTLFGAQTQVFRDFALKQNADGSVSTLPLLDMGAVPGIHIDGRTLPEADLALVNSAPQPATADYAAQAQAFIRANAPDEWQGLAVGFQRAFLGTVRFEDAFPSGSGERGLLPGMAQEVWGLPVSRPLRDPNTPTLVYLRWERGVMAFDAKTGEVEAIPLGDTFRAVLTGENIPRDLQADAQASAFYAQFQPSAMMAVARPDALPDSSLVGAFQVNGGAGFTSAAAANQQYAQPYATPSPTVDPYAASWTPTPYGQSYPGQINSGQINPNQANGGQTYPGQTNPNQPYAFGTPTPTPYGWTGNQGYPGQQPYPGQSNPGQTNGTGAPGIGSGAISGGTTAGGPLPVASSGVDVCVGDEQITFAPDTPRVGNDLLIAVSSSRPHPYGRLAGTQATQFQRERQGQLGLVWEWIVQPTYPSKHKYTFYVDSTIPCKEIEFTVENQLMTSTPKPTKTPKPDNNNNNYGYNGSIEYADLAVTLNGSTQIAPNSEVSYTAFVVNQSSYDADDSTFNATVSGSGVDAKFTDASTSSGDCSRQDQLVTCNLKRIDRGKTVNVTLRVRAGNVASNQSSYPTFVTNVNVSTSRSESNFSNNSSSTTTTVSSTQGSHITPTDPVFGVNCSNYPALCVTPGTQTPTPAPRPFDPRDYIGRGDAYNCIDFESQAQAQAVLRLDPSDPNRLDRNKDGIACGGVEASEDGVIGGFMPPPYNGTPVPRP